MRWWSAVALVVGLAACGSSDSSPATTAAASIAAPTVAPTTIASSTSVPVPTVLVTTVPPTTIATTTAPPTTTIASTTAAPTTTLVPSATAEQEILATLDAFNTDFDACLTDPQTCDQPAFLDKYVAVDDTGIRTFINNAWDYYTSTGRVRVTEGLIDRSTVSVQVSDDGMTGSTHLCEVSRAYDSERTEVPAASVTAPPGETPIFGQFYYEWAKQPDGRWLIIHSEWTFGYAANEMSEGDAPSLSPQDLAECFE